MDLVKGEMNTKLRSRSHRLTSLCQKLITFCVSIRNQGVHSGTRMAAAGFGYTGDRDTALCKDCGLEISNWTLDMDPFSIHMKQKPDCPYVQSIMRSTSSEQGNRCDHQQIEKISSFHSSNILYGTSPLEKVRRRTFSNWSQNTTPSIEQMIEAGFSSCDINDRVICVYCNLICQQWRDTDDPFEVHKTLSPTCPYITTSLIRRLPIINESSATFTSINEIAFRAAQKYPFYAELLKRRKSFSTWPGADSSFVEGFIKAGFFYWNKVGNVTCFYCNGSLTKCGSKDNLMIAHARYFPNCAYAKQYCGPKWFRLIQKRHNPQSITKTEQKSKPGVMLNTNTSIDSQEESMLNEITLSGHISARLDLVISKWLLNQNFQQSVIKRCWENQLRIKGDDFKSELDLPLACLILQKQIEHIGGKKENIVIPHKKMNEIRRQRTSKQSKTTDQSGEEMIKQSTDSSSSSLCTVCLTDEKVIAFIPCGHLATCVPCGHSLKSCLICRADIQGYCRINR